MKQCPNCQRKYFDDETNYCMNCRYPLKHIEGTECSKRSDLSINDTPEKRQKYINSTVKVECPYCKSTDTKKVGIISRSFSIGLFGLGSSKLGKQWHCNKCNSDF